MKWNEMKWHDMTCHDMTWNIMWWLKRDMTDENGDMWWQKLSHSCVKNNTSIKSPRANGFNISDVKPFNIIEFNPLCEFSHRVDDVESCWFNVSFLCEKQCWIRLATLFNTVQQLYPIPDQNPQALPYFRPKRLKNHTLWGRTYLSGFREFPLPPGCSDCLLLRKP